MKVLVIFDLVPEETKFAICEMAQEEYDFLSKCHGIVVNIDDHTDEQYVSHDALNQALCTEPEYVEYCDDSLLQWSGKYKDLVSTHPPSNLSGVEKMIYTGFLL